MATHKYFKVFHFQPLKIVIRNFWSTSTKANSFDTLPKYTNKITFLNENSYEAIPIYRILSPDNTVPSNVVKLDGEFLLKMYENMVKVVTMDKILYESQRQGRISFYMTNTGEEALLTGSASALTLDDVVYAQYRESGVLLWRGFKYADFLNQCFGNLEDPAKGRQMPVHYGSKNLNFVMISSPLGTQMPQAVGAAYALKYKKKKACVVCYFGEGAASEGDAHPAFNFAATLNCPILFICRNNGYAISTPSKEQYKGDGIAARGPAYGINTIRVDGNDAFAMHYATKEARDFCINHGKPVLLEAMTYRVGDHSTSDDSTAYRSHDEINKWREQSPLIKFRQYLINSGMWDDEKESQLRKSILNEFMADFKDAEVKLKPHWKEMFTDVYHELPDHLKKQMELMENHLKNYGEHYPLSNFKST